MEKNPLLRIPIALNNHVKAYVRVMKISFFLLFVCIAQVFAVNSNAQNAVIRVSSNTVSLREFFNDIEKQTDYLVVYSTREVNATQKVTFNQTSDKVSSLLSAALENTDIQYEFENDYIVLTKKGIISQEQGSVRQAGKKVIGKILDEAKEPMIGVNVQVRGTTIGTVSDLDGNFTLEVPDENAILVFSYLGYEKKEVLVGNQASIQVVLREASLGLNEVIVVGYGTQKKGEVASAITSIKSENFLKGSIAADAAQLIRGQVPGLSVITPDANPTSESQIALRGIATLKTSASPLVLIDGIPGSLNTVSPEDIQQIDVLKDGSAAAIYGTRGTNGVILITTKNVSGEMPTVVDVNAYLSTQQITRRFSMMDADQYRELVKLGKPGAQDGGSSTDWLDEILRTPLTQIYNVSLRGGSRNTNYIASFEYRSLNGIVKRSDNQMIYPRVEITHRMFNNKLKINASLSGYKQEYFSGSDGGSYNTEVYRNALIDNPTDPVKDQNGVWTERTSNTDYANAMALLYEVEGKNEATNLRAFGTVTYTPVEGLNIKYLASTNVYNQVRGYYETKKHLSTVKSSRNGYASRGTTRTSEDISELTAQYNKTIKDHSFTLLGGYSWLRDNYQNYYMQNYNFPSDNYTYNSMQSGQALVDGRATENSEQRENTLVGYFGRVNYNYKGKYMFAASLRYEGSSKFGANYKWGTFPSVSGAWNIKGEDFMNDVSFLSVLKLRAGFGVTGTEPSDPYMSLTVLNFSDYIYYGGQWLKIIKPNSNPNPDLRWERKEETNIGLDYGFFDNRLSGTIDVYNRTTKDMLWGYAVPSPPYIYSSMMANAGSMRNRGVELGLTAVVVQTNDWRWSSTANYSTNSNKLLSLSNDKYISAGYSDEGGTGAPMQQTTHRIQEGMPIGMFYGYKAIDIDDNGHWIIEGADGKPKPISALQPTDKKYIGNGLPKHYVNWNNTVGYKKFDLTLTMRGAFGFDILNMAALQYGAPVMLTRGNILSTAYDNIFGKRPLADDQSLQYVDYYIEKGDYWKIDNLTIGYTLDFDKTWIQRLRVYGTVTNLAVITGYSGIDPEVGVTGLAPGVDNKNRYPAARTFTLGVSLKF